MKNRFFTLLLIPEKTSKVRRFVVPSWILKGSALAVLFLAVLSAIMLLDYWYVMDQLSENKKLKVENRRLRQQVQIFDNKMDAIEGTLDRVENFATRLRVITNLEDQAGLMDQLNAKTSPPSFLESASLNEKKKSSITPSLRSSKKTRTN